MTAQGCKSLIQISGLAAALAAFTVGPLVSPVVAQQDWMPTVATSPGGTLNEPMPGALNRAPTKIDPRYFPSPRSAVPPVRHTLPQGAWSPIVTGALPKAGDGADAAQRPAARGPGVPVAPLDLSPVRPMPRQAAAPAAGEPEKAEAVKAGATPGASPAVSEDEPLFKKPGPLDALPPNASAAQQYCFNTADRAADARFAWQAKKIQDMEAALDQKARELESKTEEYKRWLERRDDFSRKAHEKLVGFYTRMRPDAAAVQLATVDEEMAAAVVMKLQTKVASAIMGEMDPERAAKIAEIISGAGHVPANKRPPAPPAAPADAPANAASQPQGEAPAPEGPRS